jgi:hypothetical protein
MILCERLVSAKKKIGRDIEHGTWNTEYDEI